MKPDNRRQRSSGNDAREHHVILIGVATIATQGPLPGICDVAIGMQLVGLQQD